LKTTLPSLTAVTRMPRFIQSVAEELDGFTVVYTTASLGVKEADHAFRPVKELVEEGCFTIRVNEVVEDDEVWDGRSRYSEIEVYDSCPTKEHYCKHRFARIGEALGMK